MNPKIMLLDAALLTLEVSMVGMAIAIGAGFTLAVMRVFGPWPARWLAVLYIEIVRGTPLLIQLTSFSLGFPPSGSSSLRSAQGSSALV
jgi:polar amino acid transport system substrate-binding protein